MSLKELTQALMFVFVGLLWQNSKYNSEYET